MVRTLHKEKSRGVWSWEVWDAVSNLEMDLDIIWYRVHHFTENLKTWIRWSNSTPKLYFLFCWCSYWSREYQDRAGSKDLKKWRVWKRQSLTSERLIIYRKWTPLFQPNTDDFIGNITECLTLSKHSVRYAPMNTEADK